MASGSQHMTIIRMSQRGLSLILPLLHDDGLVLAQGAHRPAIQSSHASASNPAGGVGTEVAALAAPHARTKGRHRRVIRVIHIGGTLAAAILADPCRRGALGGPCGDIRSTTGVPQTATELAASR
jgi:hypothetical protein